MATTPHLGLTLIEQSQAQKEVTMNMALMRIDALLNSGAMDKDLSTPPASPVDGDVYLVADGATGDWEGHEDEVAYFEQVWRFITPNSGLMLWVADEGAFYLFDGTEWVPTSGGASLSGLSDVALDSPAHGEVLRFDTVSGGWVNDVVEGGGGGGEANTASNVNGDAGGVFKDKSGAELRFNNLVAGDNITLSGGGASGGDVTITGGAGATSPALADVSDVTVTAVTSGELLGYSGSQWVNRTLVEAGIAASDHSHVLADISDVGGLAAKSTIDNDDWSGAALAVANGGTGLTSVAADGLLAGNGAGALHVRGVKVDDDDCIYGFAGKVQVQTGASYTLVAGDTGKIIECSHGSAITLTLPNDLPQGFTCTVMQKGAGAVSFSPASGAARHHRQSHTKTAGQYAACTLYVTENSDGTSAAYVLAGDTQE
jgi:hypothetical protein